MNTGQRRLTAFLASIAALTSLSIDMSLPSIPALEHRFGLTAGRGSLTMSLFLAGYAFTPLVGGPLADRFGRKPVLCVSLVCFALAALGCSIASGFLVLCLFRLLQGCAAGVATTLPLAILRDLLSGAAARKRVAEVTVINSIMPILAPLLGLMVLRAGSWRLIFFMQSIFAGGILLALLIGFDESMPHTLRRTFSIPGLLRTLRYLLHHPLFRYYALINGLTFASVFSFISVSPLLLMQHMGISHHLYSLLFALMATGSVLGSLLSAHLAKRQAAADRVILTGILLMVAMAGVALLFQLAALHGPSFLIIPVFFALLGFGLIVPAVTVGAVEPMPDFAGTGSGALRSILMLAGSGASALLATLCARKPVYAEVITMLTMLTLTVVALALYLRLTRLSSHSATPSQLPTG